LSYDLDPHSASALGQGGRPAFKEASLMKEVDLLTPSMSEAVAFGHHLTQVVFLQQGFPPGSAHAVILFSDVLFTNHQIGSSGGGEIPTESYSFSYLQMAFMSQAQFLGLKGGAAALYNLASWFR
jgi:type VI protein secretion system component Hcp